ncbi:hypothetical protein LAZ67_2004032 [Cordylochernes scorpioides]|uniref:HTH CENPB-type domain-containing protein n=1 Tax=Cordylochernes scorpioides TaxID=51811 RepID=A0ABY6K3J9_9ARAC|nr:hypothetical protein LAZ67_2004032 [Cordylochernes scorpioides]
MGQDNFEASNGWLEKFKARRNIAFKRLHGEAGSVDANSVATWKGGIIPSLLAEYSPQDIFNADETGLFYKLLPNQTMTIRGEKCEGDNCPAHQIPEGLQNIEIRFLPALTTSALQPCDMGIIKALKDQYRKRMITYLLTCMEEKKNAKVHLLFAISWLEDAWVGVSSSTIKNCFSHSGFVMDEAMEEVVEEEMNRCFEALKNIKPLMSTILTSWKLIKMCKLLGNSPLKKL